MTSKVICLPCKSVLLGGGEMLMLTTDEVTKLKKLLHDLSREILLQGGYQRRITRGLAILSKNQI